MSKQEGTETIDLRAIVKKVTALWWVFLLTAGACVALGVAYIKRTPKKYRVQAVLMMSDQRQDAFGGREEFLKGVSYLRNNVDVQDQLAVLTSRNNMTKALKRLDFDISFFETKDFRTVEKYEYPPFFVKLDSVAFQVIDVPIHVSVDRAKGTYRVKAEGEFVSRYNLVKRSVVEGFIETFKVDQEMKIGEPFVADNLSFTINFPEDREYGDGIDHFFIIHSLDGLVTGYRERVSADPLDDESNIVVLSVVGEVVAKEVAFLNKLMETYIEGELYKQQQKGLKTINFIDEQLGTVTDSLRRVESSMENFRGSSGGMISAENTSDVLFQERSRLEDERSTLLRRKRYCESILVKLRSADDLRNVPAPSSSGIDDPVLNNQVIELTKLAAELAAMNLTTVRSNPTVIAMERKMKSIRSSLIETAEGLVEQAEISIQELDRRLGRINYQFNQLPENERRLVNIERKQKLTDNLYNYLMEKRAEAGIAIASDQVDKTIIDEARVEGRGPVSPDKKVVLGGALVLGLMLPLLFLLVRDLLNDTIQDVEELKRASSIPVLAAIPASKRKRVLPEDPKSLLAESFRTVRINLQYLNPDKRPWAIGLTSSTSGEGKTFCAVNLASVFALSGRRTLLIDADMRRPRVADHLGLDTDKGLSTYLIGEATLDDVVLRTEVQGLEVIAAGPIPPNPLELVELPRMAELFESLRERYDQVVVDASPMGLVSEYVILMRHLDVTLYVVRRGETSRNALRLVNELHRDGKLGAIDLLLNDVKPGQGYAQSYGYYAK